MREESFLKGAMFLTIASFIVKLFGFIYVIPFVAMVGEEKYILFEYAYKPYVIFIALATLGIPTAFAKYIAKARERGDYEAIERLFKSGLIVMTITGIISFAMMYLSAEWIANFLITGNDATGNSVTDVVFVIRMVSFALLVVPILSLLRGTLQGYKLMSPTAYSQIWEQVTRIIIILGGTYLLVKVLDRSATLAIGIATFSAFVSGLVAIGVLVYYLRKTERGFKMMRMPVKREGQVKIGRMYGEVVWYAIPIVLVGLSITIFQTIDTFSLNQILTMKGKTLGEAEIVNSIVALVQKIIMIPLAFGTALSMSLIAFVTQSYEAKNVTEIREWISKSVKVNLFFVIPSTIGLLLLSGPIYGAVFGTKYAIVGGETLLYYAFAPLVFSMYSITASILQGMHKNKTIVTALVIGVAIKLIANYPLVLFIEGGGTAIATYLGLGVAILIQMATIQREAQYNWVENVLQMKNVFLSNMWMAIILVPFTILALSSRTYFENFVLVFIAVSIGAAVYMYASYKNKSLFEVVPEHRIEKVLSKISRK